jgi:undecaprenyl-diphosphatase
VGRPRPAVPRLDGSPVDSSFPSGHAAAATCYAAMAVVVFWHTRARVWRTVAVVLAVLVPVIVGVARMYRGMHHLTDVAGGIVLGAATVTITVLVVTRAEARREKAAAAADRVPDGDRIAVGAAAQYEAVR